MSTTLAALLGLAAGLVLGIGGTLAYRPTDIQAQRIEACRDACGPGRVKGATVDEKGQPHCECAP